LFDINKGVFHIFATQMEEVRYFWLNFPGKSHFLNKIKIKLKGAFVIAFLIMLILVGLPLFFLELTISQYSKKIKIY